MKRLGCFYMSAITLAALCAGSVTVSLALAQPPGGPGGQGGQFGGPGGPMTGMRPITVTRMVSFPAAAI